MINSKFKKSAFAILCFSSIGFSTPVVINSNISNLNLVKNQNITGSFDLSSYMNADKTYKVENSYITYSFSDIPELNFASKTESSWQNTYWQTAYLGMWGFVAADWTKTVNNYFYDSQIDKATVTVEGSADVVGQASYKDIVTTTVAYDHYDEISYNGYPCHNHYYINTVNHQTGYYGDFSVIQNLGSSSLDDLAADGILAFNVSGTDGNFKFLSAELHADLVEVASVPEPATFSLMAFSLLLLFAGVPFVRRGKN